MGVEPKIKLNLKALKQEDIKQGGESNETLDKDIIPSSPKENTPEIKSDDIEKDILPVENTTSDKKEDSKSHNISFADLKKQIDKKTPSSPKTSSSNNIEDESSTSLEGKTEDLTSLDENKVPEVIKNDTTLSIENLENKTIDNTSLEGKKINGDIKKKLNSNTISDSDESLDLELKAIEEEEKNAKKDKAALENAEKAKAILHKKDEIKEKKKKDFFSFFKMKKKKAKKLEGKNDNTKDIHQKNEIEGNISKNQDNENNQEAKIPKEKIHFSNYESHFKKESTNFLKRFQKFKYAPSTRIGMILSLIGTTTIIIAGLMMFFPEKHSISIYKASILELTGKSQIEEKITDEIPVNKEDIILETGEKEDIENNDIQKDNPIIIEEKNEEEKSKEKLRQHLLNKYK